MSFGSATGKVQGFFFFSGLSVCHSIETKENFLRLHLREKFFGVACEARP
jgi:hypothetical protein